MNSKLAASLMILVVVYAFAANVTDNKLSNANKILKFLQSIPASARAEMDSILKNTTLTKGEIEKKLDEWASKQSGEFPNQYNEVKSLLNAGLKTNGKMSSNAEQQIANIRQNKSLTRLEERKAILDILEREPSSEEHATNFAFPDLEV